MRDRLEAIVEPWDVEREVVRRIMAREPAARDELPTLLRIVDGDDDELRSRAAEAIGAVAPGAEELSPRLRPALLHRPRFDLPARRFARGVTRLGRGDRRGSASRRSGPTSATARGNLLRFAR